MCRLLETIAVKNGRLQQLPFHQRRFDAARRALWGLPATDLESLIELPAGLGAGLYKCRVVYGPSVETVQVTPYAPRSIRSLRLIDGDHVDYRYKYADRRVLQALFERRRGCDDILIVQEGRLTDTSYSNIALYDGRRWVTPARPLLAGTARARLLATGRLEAAEVRVADLVQYRSLRLVNAMLDWATQPPIPVQQIFAPSTPFDAGIP